MMYLYYQIMIEFNLLEAKLWTNFIDRFSEEKNSASCNARE